VVRGREVIRPERQITMLYTIAVILLIAWLLGVAGTYTIGAFVHVLLVVALVLFVVGLLSGRRSLV
jgi:asparagine N-glycosylation enzyme membrane subunit Stt3